MAFSTRGKLVVAASGAALLVAALLVAPLLIDMNAYKPEIAAQVRQATGRDVVIDGAVSLSLLPAPSVTVDGVRFFNAPGSKNPNMVEVKSVVVRPSLPALLIGEVEVSQVTLVEPKIVLEVNAEGKPNWEFAPSVAEARPAAPKPASPKPLSLGRLDIENGTLIFSDSKAGLSMAADKANFTASVGSIEGPYTLAGRATVNDATLKLDLSVGARGATGYTVDLTLDTGGGRLAYKGTVSELGPGARLSGTASASADNLVAFVGTLAGIAGQPPPVLPPLLAGKFKFDGPVELSQFDFAAKDFKLALGDDSGAGSLAVALKPTPTIEASFTARRLDLDRWLAGLAAKIQPTAEVEPPLAPPPVAPTAAAAVPAAPGWLAAITAKLALEVGEIVYNKKPVRDVALQLEARGGAVAVPKLTATFPGDLVVQARSTLSGDPARPAVSGDFSLAGDKLRETLAWLEVDASSVPADKLRRLRVKGRMASLAGNVQVDDAVFELDDVKGAGGIVVAFTVPLSVITHVEVDTLDLDSFLPPAGKGPSASASPAASVTPLLALLGPSLGLKLKFGKIVYRGDAAAGVDVEVARQAGTLRLDTVRVADLAGARLAIRGRVANYWTPRPQADFALSFETPDMDRLLKLAGATPAGLGAVRASGGVSGNWESLALRDLALNAMGWSLQASGALALPGAAEGVVKRASYKGSVSVNGQPIEVSLDADLGGRRPVITADLKTSVLDFGKLGGAGATAPSSAAGQSALASQPIGTPLRAFDGTLRVSAGSLGGAPLPVGNAEIAASLKGGVLTISRFTAGLYGGTLNFAGTVDGSRPALSFDLKGGVAGVNLAEMLRSRSGSNEIGSLIRIAIDGSLSASNVRLRGAGTTVAELRSSMAGGAQVSGHVLARADRFMQMLGSAATGAAGGVIDTTLGNLMSVLGDKGGVGVGNLLNAISLVLNRFVNHDNALAGQVEVAGGVLTDHDLRLQGDRATARITTRTDLAAATTDTTIAFMLAEEPSAPYLIVTARGPMGSPSVGATRGSAKDPPGMIGTFLGNMPSLPSVPLPSIPLPRIPNIFGR